MVTVNYAEYFSKPENRFENERTHKDGAYLFQDANKPTPPAQNGWAALAAKETEAGIVYHPELAALIEQKSAEGATLYDKLIKNAPIDELVNKYIAALEAKWSKEKKPEDAIRIIDFYVMSNRFGKAKGVNGRAEVKHDLFEVLAFAGQKDSSTAVGFWTAFASSPFARSIGKVYSCCFFEQKMYQALLVEHGEHVSAFDALVLSSYVFENQHPVTVLLHNKWMKEQCASSLPKSPQSAPAPDVDFSSLAKSKTDLIGSYRASVCMLGSDAFFKFNAQEIAPLRQTFLEAVALGKWKIGEAIGLDIARRCTSTEHLEDVLLMFLVVGQMLASLHGNSTEETRITKMLKTGGTLKGIFADPKLAGTIFVKKFSDKIEDEVEELIGCEAIYKHLLFNIRKLDLLGNDKAFHLKQITDLAYSLFKILIEVSLDLEEVADKIASDLVVSNFLRKGHGYQFANKCQNERMKQLFKLIGPKDTPLKTPEAARKNSPSGFKRSHKDSKSSEESQQKPTAAEAAKKPIPAPLDTQPQAPSVPPSEAPVVSSTSQTPKKPIPAPLDTQPQAPLVSPSEAPVVSSTPQTPKPASNDPSVPPKTPAPYNDFKPAPDAKWMAKIRTEEEVYGNGGDAPRGGFNGNRGNFERNGQYRSSERGHGGGNRGKRGGNFNRNDPIRRSAYGGNQGQAENGARTR